MTSVAPIAIPDPRTFPDPETAAPEVAAVYRQAEARLAAQTGQHADAADRALEAALSSRLAGDGTDLAALLARATATDGARHLWRLLEALCRAGPDPPGAVAATVFAIPVIVIAAREAGPSGGTLPGVIDDPAALVAILDEHRALGGNRTFALANALVGVDAIDVDRLPEIRSWQRLPEASAATASAGAAWAAPALASAPIAFGVGREAVSLRFVVGSALAGAHGDFLAATTVGQWGMPFTQALGRALAAPGVCVLALPRAPHRPLSAVQQGRAAQREVSAQLFVGNALRRLRAAAGEPTAVISAHCAPDAPGGGELRLSLSSAFEPRDAEGFRCPLYPLDRVGDVAAMLVALLRDCRVADLRVLGGVHPDRDPGTGLPLLFKPETIPPTAVAH